MGALGGARRPTGRATTRGAAVEEPVTSLVAAIAPVASTKRFSTSWPYSRGVDRERLSAQRASQTARRSAVIAPPTSCPSSASEFALSVALGAVEHRAALLTAPGQRIAADIEHQLPAAGLLGANGTSHGRNGTPHLSWAQRTLDRTHPQVTALVRSRRTPSATLVVRCPLGLGVANNAGDWRAISTTRTRGGLDTRALPRTKRARDRPTSTARGVWPRGGRTCDLDLSLDPPIGARGRSLLVV